MKVVVISEDSALSSALNRYFRNLCHAQTQLIRFSSFHPGESDLQIRAAAVFESVVDIFVGRDGADTMSLSNTLVVVNDADISISPAALNPVRTSPPPSLSEIVVSMLVLAFPEAHWLFVCMERGDGKELPPLNRYSSSSSLAEILAYLRMGFTPLFDAGGLREAIRANIGNVVVDGRRICAHVPARTCLAAAIDDELQYACFHAYAAYRFGFRSYMVNSYAMMKSLFFPKARRSSEPLMYSNNGGKITLVLEDLYLRFYDAGERVHLSDLASRDRILQGLARVPFRVFVTIGHKRVISDSRWQNNISHLRRVRGQGQWNKILFKPNSGLLDLWERSGLRDHIGRNGRAPGFDWPYHSSHGPVIRDGHSTPGRLLAIATKLIHRAAAALENAQSVSDCIYGAVLVQDALEYAGPLTPTTTLEALALKHKLEVKAECMFYGVGYNTDAAGRLSEVRAEVSSIADQLHPSTKRLSALTAELHIVNELALEYREFNHFDEEQECMSRIRTLNRQIWFQRRKAWAWVLYPVRWYVDFLLSSVPAFAILIFSWLLLFAGLFGFIQHGQETGVLHGLRDSVVSFIGLGSIHDPLNSAFLIGVNTFASLIGFLHLGVFISHLYTTASRR